MAMIEVNHLTKEYRLGAMQGLKQKLLNTAARLTGKKAEERPLFKALDDISFSIEQGEVVGIIGHNGAGKSTLLKMLARISTPTHGTAKVNGRIAPLIEVGAGFVPDFTGRENVYLNGAILGMSRHDIDRKFDEIVAFAEMEEFIDTPVKRYSSGMKVRLAFAVATSNEAEILIVDEVLAVGDLAFQRKCFDRIEDLIKRGGNTVLLVSHNIRQIERMCTRAILLDHGKILADGKTREIADLFYVRSNEKIKEHVKIGDGTKASIQSSGEVELLGVDILNEDNDCTDEIESGDMLRVRVTFKLMHPIKKMEIVVGTHTTDFIYLSAASTAAFDDRPDYDPGQHEVEYIVQSFPLVSGSYCIRVAMFDANRRLVYSGETLKTFHVAPIANEAREPPLRNLNIPTDWLMQGKRYSRTPGSGLDSRYSVLAHREPINR